MSIDQHDLSYGVIPLKKEEGTWWTFLIFREKGFWEFPKGHPEPGELPQQAAARELKEETGLEVSRWLSDTSFEMNYEFKHEGKRIAKKAIYFLAEVTGKVALEADEVQQGKWVKWEEAPHHLTFENTRALCFKAKQVFLFGVR